jgi:hypothetical protein
MKNTLIKVFVLLGLAFIADACLNDDRTDYSKVGTVIEFLDATPGSSLALDIKPTVTDDTLIYVRVNATGVNAPSHDLEIGIGSAGDAGLLVYNQDDQHVVGTLLPSDAYELPSSVTIKAEKENNIPNRTATFAVKLHPSKIPQTLGVNYVLPIAITSAPEGTVISGNFGYTLFNFYHNIYDGAYTSNGTRWNFNAAADYGGWDLAGQKPNASSTIASKSPWSFSTKILTLNAQSSLVHAGNADGGFGMMKITVSETQNPDGTYNVDIASTCPANDGSCPAPQTALANLVPLGGGTQSTYDPATKTFDLYYKYTNTTGTFRVLHDVLVHE